MLTIDVLIIGAGMSGLVAASTLKGSGFKVACVEKARGSGGRMSSKRIINSDENSISFDMGCPSFKASTDVFRNQLDKWQRSGVVAEWSNDHNPESIEYIGTPRNSSITRHLANDLEVHFSKRITHVRKSGAYWLSYTGEGNQRTLFSSSRFLVFATPPQQAADLLPTSHELQPLLSTDLMHPQWVVMLKIKGRLDLHPLVFEGENSVIQRAFLEDSKSSRRCDEGYQVWTFHTSEEWTLDHLNENKDTIADLVFIELERLVLAQPILRHAHYVHRWLYSTCREHDNNSIGYVWTDDGIGACGDYLASGMTSSNVEAAFTSGHMLANNIPSR